MVISNFPCVWSLLAALCHEAFTCTHVCYAGQPTCSLSSQIALSCVYLRYVSGDFRFRTGYCRSNPRKMVKMWAEKELRNLSRLRAAGIRAPGPLLLRMHVLVMEFIGTDGVAAPKLKVLHYRGAVSSYGLCCAELHTHCLPASLLDTP